MRFLELVLDIEEPDTGGARQQDDREMDEQNGTMPTAQISSAAMTATARLVAMVDIHGTGPERIMPKGSRCFNRKTQTGPMPNITSGCL